jgi:hypothetical protein
MAPSLFPKPSACFAGNPNNDGLQAAHPQFYHHSDNDLKLDAFSGRAFIKLRLSDHAESIEWI